MKLSDGAGIRLLVCGLFVCSLAGHALAVDTPPFADVAVTDARAEALAFLKDHGVVQGYEDGSFQPERTMNRAEALKMLYVGVNEDISSVGATSGFPDVPADAWFRPYVLLAKGQGVVKGYNDGTFKPGNKINKAEALKILMLIVDEDLSKVTLQEKNSYTGGQDLWYAPYLLRANQMGLIDALNPEDYLLAGDITRGELAEMLYRVLYIREKGLETYPLYESGRVSYYSDSLIGNNTSSGEKYDAELFTAAHRDAALKSFIQVIDNDTKKSLLVRVNDRGPSDTRGVADLSRAAFRAFYPTSKGVFNGTVYELPAQIQAPAKTYIRSDIFADMQLQSPVPNIFWQDELYLLVAEKNSSLPVFNLTSPSGKTEVLEAVTIGEGSVYQLSFAEQGNYTLERPGSTPKRITLAVLPRFQGKKVGQWTADKPTFNLVKGVIPALSWSQALPNVILRLTLTQGDQHKTVYANTDGMSRLALTGPLFKGFNFAKALTISVDGATTSTRFSHDIYTEWQALGTAAGDGGVGTNAPMIEPTTVPDGDFSQQLKDILARVNQERAKNGVKAVTLDVRLDATAQFKADDMAKNNYFSHTNLQGQDVNDWKVNYNFVPMIAENIAYSTEGVMADLENLIKSPGHYANMIDPRFEIMGVGIAVGDGKTYMVQHFSTRPLSADDLAKHVTAMQTTLQDAGVKASYSAAIGGVAQRWANDISAKQSMTFQVEGKDVGEVLQSEVGGASYSFAVYGDVGLESLDKSLAKKLGEFPNASAYGFGYAIDKEGMVRLTVIIKK